MNPITGEDLSFDCVTDYQLSKSGDKLIYITSKEGDEDTLSIHVYYTASQKTVHLLKSQLDIDRITFDEADELMYLCIPPIPISENLHALLLEFDYGFGGGFD